MFPISGNGALSFLLLEKFSSLFAQVWSFCPSFLGAGLTFSCPITWEFPTLFLSSSFLGLTRDPNLGPDILFALTVHHQIGGSLAFATGEPSLEVVSCPHFENGTNDKKI